MPIGRTNRSGTARQHYRCTREQAQSIVSRRRGAYTLAMRGLQPSEFRRVWEWLAKLILFAEATSYLFAVWAGLRWFQFEKVMATASRLPARKLRSADVGELRWAVDRCARLVPWRAMCIERALALQAMARRRGVASLLHYGIKQEGNGLSAHVWLSVDAQIVIGGETAADYVCTATFPADAQFPVGHPPPADLR